MCVSPGDERNSAHAAGASLTRLQTAGQCRGELAAVRGLFVKFEKMSGNKK